MVFCSTQLALAAGTATVAAGVVWYLKPTAGWRWRRPRPQAPNLSASASLPRTPVEKMVAPQHAAAPATEPECSLGLLSACDADVDDPVVPTSRGGRAMYYVDEAEEDAEDAEDAPAAGGASRNGERRRCEMHDRACNGASPGLPHAGALLPSRQSSSTHYLDEGDEEEPVRPPVMLSQNGASYYVDEDDEGEEGEEEPTWPPMPVGVVLSSVSCRLLLYGEPKLVSFEADLSRDTAPGLALELVCELGLDEDETTLHEIERQIGVALKVSLAAQPDRASLC